MFMVAFGISTKDVGKRPFPNLIVLSGVKSFEVMFFEIPFRLFKFGNVVGALLLFGNVN